MKQVIKYITSFDNTRIAYAINGNGPPLVKTATYITHLEHDWNSPIWHPVLTNLSRYHTLIRYDERGSGLSDWHTRDYSFEAWVKDLKAVVDAEKLDRFILYGQSQGGAVAVAFAARYPERVEKLIVFGGYARGWLRRDLSEDGKLEEQMLIDLMKVGWGQDNPAFRHFFTGMLMPDADIGQMKAFDLLMKLSTEPEIAARLERQMHLVDVRNEAPNVQCPALILHARYDKGVPYSEGKYLADLIPRSRFVQLESRNHVMHENDPAWIQLWKEIYQFVGVEGDFMQQLGQKEIFKRVLRTIVFTDIVDSTRIAAHLGDKQWTQQLEEHNERLRQKLKAYGGDEINNTGDGFLLFFESPTQAIFFAKAFVQDIEQGPIQIRCGIHTGEVELSEKDAHGIHVHIAARVMQEAGANEIYVTSTVKELMEGSNMQFNGKGLFKLKGLDIQKELFLVPA